MMEGSVGIQGVAPMIERTQPVTRPSESVLLVDDDQDLGDMFQLGLENAGFAVQRAADGMAAVDLVLRQPPDLVLMDQGLPGLNGLQALEQLQSNRRGLPVPVVMFSNADDDALVRKAFALGALEWVVKAGITPRQLAGRVRTWLDAVYRPDAARRFRSSMSWDATITSDIQASPSA
jgi:DNA-binding response OmpR family regulator